MLGHKPFLTHYTLEPTLGLLDLGGDCGPKVLHLAGSQGAGAL